jgi:hypothetical protein
MFETDELTIAPGRSYEAIITLPATTGTYPLYNRDPSRYPGSTDNNAWVGGQRTEIQVTGGLRAQAFPGEVI